MEGCASKLRDRIDGPMLYHSVVFATVFCAFVYFSPEGMWNTSTLVSRQRRKLRSVAPTAYPAFRLLVGSLGFGRFF